MDIGDSLELGAPVHGRHYVYGLYDPRTGDMGYVGYTNSPAGRLSEHLAVAYRDQQKGVAAWVRSLLDEGVTPQLRILSVHPTMDEAIAAEYALIRDKRGEWPLVNFHGSPENKRKRGAVAHPRVPPAHMSGLLPVRDVVRILGVSRQRVHQLIRLVGIKPRRFGPAIALSTEDIELMRSHRAPRGRPRKIPLDSRNATA